MNFTIIFLALLWAVAADKEAENQPFRYLRTRNLKMDLAQREGWRRKDDGDEMCLAVDGVGYVTVSVEEDDDDGSVGNLNKWFVKHGAVKGECEEEIDRITRSDLRTDTFCRKINKNYYQLEAPDMTADWHEDEDWAEGTCWDLFGKAPDEQIEMKYTGTATRRGRGWRSTHTIQATDDSATIVSTDDLYVATIDVLDNDETYNSWDQPTNRPLRIESTTDPPEGEGRCLPTYDKQALNYYDEGFVGMAECSYEVCTDDDQRTICDTAVVVIEVVDESPPRRRDRKRRPNRGRGRGPQHYWGWWWHIDDDDEDI